MRVVSKGGQPDMVVRSVAQTLANPYSSVREINVAMGYTPTSSVGPHYLNTAVLAGLLTETPQGWFRPTEAGRRLLLDAPEGSGAGQNAAVWDALLALPGFRAYLEYKILTIIERSRRYPALPPQIEAAAFAAFPDYRSRAVSLQQMLRLPELRRNEVFDEIRNPPALEPIGWEAIRAWAWEMGLGPSRSDLTRASEIGQTLARAAQFPLCVRSEWLTSAQVLALLLLIAARERSQGIALPDDGASQLAQAVEALRKSGLDIRLERRGRMQVAALLPAVTLRIASAPILEKLTDDLRRWPEMARLARVIVAALSAGLRVGVDGEQRGEMTPAELANACAEALEEGLGAFASAAAADEMPLVEGNIILGPPMPLATDAIRLGREYRFLSDALRAQARREQGGVAVLLSEWLTQQRQSPQQELAVNPHLALLYLIAADSHDRAERLARRDVGWLYAGEPLISALDDRLRGLGYTVWDEGYCRDEQRAHALGAALVEQGLRIGALSVSDDPSAPLEAPTTYGYYEALDLLAIEPATRSAR